MNLEKVVKMKLRIKTAVLGAASCALSTVVNADAGVAVSAEAGYRVDNLDWNIADIDGDPNILSELTWSSLNIRQVKLNLDVTYKRLRLFGMVGYGEIDKGDNQDSDYNANNRQAEFSRSNNQAEGDVNDVSVGLGYVIETSQRRGAQAYFMPMAGYSIHKQELKMTNGFQAIPATGAFSGLNSSYDTEWNGPWVGMSFWETDARRGLTVGLDLIYHKTDYDAEANWNLRTDFAHPLSFEHWSDATGLTASLHGRYAVSKSWDFIMSLDYQSWQTDVGVDRVYAAAGGSTDTQLNDANWDSIALNFGVAWRPGR